MNTTWEQLESAAVSLARSGAIKDRLAEAYRNHLALVNAEELPAALREEFRACHDTLTRERPLRGEDAVRATVRKMSNQRSGRAGRSAWCGCSRPWCARRYARTSRSSTPRSPTPAVNGAATGAPRKRKSVPQVISLYSAEAQVSRA